MKYLKIIHQYNMYYFLDNKDNEDNTGGSDIQWQVHYRNYCCRTDL